MARVARATCLQFAGSAASTDIEQFGSKQQVGTPTYTTSPSVIQGLAAWSDGWSAAIVTANKAPYKQDVNAVDYLFSNFLCYLFQQGIPEWDSGTTYYASPNPSIVQYNAGQLYESLQDANVGNAPPAGASNAYWQLITPGVQAQGVVTGSRALGSVYQNTTGRALFVAVSVLAQIVPSTTGIGYSCNALVDSNPSPTTIVAQIYLNGSTTVSADGIGQLFFIVLPGNYYSVVNVGADSYGTLAIWTEWN
jgi:hypothetical protein